MDGWVKYSALLYVCVCTVRAPSVTSRESEARAWAQLVCVHRALKPSCVCLYGTVYRIFAPFDYCFGHTMVEEYLWGVIDAVPTVVVVVVVVGGKRKKGGKRFIIIFFFIIKRMVDLSSVGGRLLSLGCVLDLFRSLPSCEILSVKFYNSWDSRKRGKNNSSNHIPVSNRLLLYI